MCLHTWPSPAFCFRAGSDLRLIFKVNSNTIELTGLLYISTSVWVLRIPKTGWNSHFQHFLYWSAFSAIFLRQDETRLEVTSRITKTVMILLISGPVARENLGKIWDETGLLNIFQHVLLIFCETKIEFLNKIDFFRLSHFLGKALAKISLGDKMKITIKRASGHWRSIFLVFWNLWSVFYLMHKPQFWQNWLLIDAHFGKK